MYWVYAISNESGKIYIGQTNDLVKRLQRHNGLLPSKTRSFTKINKGNWKVFYKEEFPTRTEAMLREKQLKSYQGRLFVKKFMAR